MTEPAEWDSSAPSPEKGQAARQGSLGLNLIAGASLGGLVGLLLGLSAVPVIASAAASLLALLVAFFGVARAEGRLATETAAARFAGFGAVMAVALAGGIALRAHGSLGPSFADRVDRFAVDGMPRERALELAAYEHLGLRLGTLAAVETPEAAPPASPYAFSEAERQLCGALEADQFASVADRLADMRSRGEPWATIGRLGATLPEADAQALAESAHALGCGARP